MSFLSFVCENGRPRGPAMACLTGFCWVVQVVFKTVSQLVAKKQPDCQESCSPRPSDRENIFIDDVNVDSFFLRCFLHLQTCTS